MHQIALRRCSTEFVGFVRITHGEAAPRGLGPGARPTNSDITSTVLHQAGLRGCLGVEFDDIDALTDKVIEREHKFPGFCMKRALGGLDTAIWDLPGQGSRAAGGQPARRHARAAARLCHRR